MERKASRYPIRLSRHVIFLPAAASLPLLVPTAWSPWQVMWATAFALYAACKWVTWVEADGHGVPPRRSIAYALAWPGLDAEAFLRKRARRRPRAIEWFFAAAKLALGVVLLETASRSTGTPDLLRGWIGMAGFVFTLHFGAFHLLSCFWRSRRFDAVPLMDWPAAATSVADFWSRRWNRGFRDLAYRFLFRPMTARFGSKAGTLAGFFFSGLVHDAVISLPAQGGYGGPTTYFLIQAAGLLAERSRIGLGCESLRRLFAALVIVLPAPLLFHTPFVTRVVVPFLEVLGTRS